MKFIKRNKRALDEAGIRAFDLLNAKILKFQSRLSVRLNAWITGFSLRAQKRIFLAFIVLCFCGISARMIFSISRPDHSRPANPGTLAKIHLQSTDSTNTKKK